MHVFKPLSNFKYRLFFYGFVLVLGFVPFEVDPFIGVAIVGIYIQPIIPLPPQAS
jgi:hypothetical protein